jgi:hypothetical protein
MDTKFVRFRYGPSVQTLALYPGLPVDEFSKILKAVLPVTGSIIGLQGEVNSKARYIQIINLLSLEWLCRAIVFSLSFSRCYVGCIICATC